MKLPLRRTQTRLAAKMSEVAHRAGGPILSHTHSAFTLTQLLMVSFTLQTLVEVWYWLKRTCPAEDSVSCESVSGVFMSP